MRALNLYALTRIRDSESVSKLSQALSGRSWQKSFSRHEVASLCALVDGLEEVFRQSGSAGSFADPSDGRDWVSFFDGFYFSYTIDHISKEFDLLKLSADGGCALNIELKSEPVEEERIRRQLDQNRYYLSHIARTILSYTYVMETDTVYCFNDHGFLKACSFSELAEAMKRPVLREYAQDGIGHFFRAQDYLISPVREPEKFLAGRYFLTNQQADFRRQILETLELYRSVQQSAGDAPVPVISLTGNAGTGKTLLLYDLARELSRKRGVLLLHGGPLGEGHRVIDARLHKVKILSGTEAKPAGNPDYLLQGPGGGRSGVPEGASLRSADLGSGATGGLSLRSADPGSGAPEGLSLRSADIGGGASEGLSRRRAGPKGRPPRCILIDEANRLASGELESLLKSAGAEKIPCILSYDPHGILGPFSLMAETEAVIRRHETMRLEMSGNIRINRPIFYFLRTLFHQKDRAGLMDFSCIDVLYAENQEEEENLKAHYLSWGYVCLDATPEAFRTGAIVNQEHDRVLMVLDRRFYYDASLDLCADRGHGAALASLYEGLSRAREKLCLIVVDNRELFLQILEIRTA